MRGIRLQAHLGEVDVVEFQSDPPLAPDFELLDAEREACAGRSMAAPLQEHLTQMWPGPPNCGRTQISGTEGGQFASHVLQPILGKQLQVAQVLGMRQIFALKAGCHHLHLM